ncbi:MAG: bacterial transcriptional activator domain-containing protein, partial [Nocardioides sp.]|nr:bacterial transcriptional activator domain-containing protein [Nocardioides sp.]
AVAAGSPPDPTPTPDGPGPGGRLRDEANPDLATWLARTLSASGIGNGVPAPAQVTVGATGLAMSFSKEPTTAPPAGWTAVNGRVWAVGDDVRPHGGAPAPMPGLVTVGRRQDGSLLLIDPEGVAGLISVEGSEDLARGVAVSMAVDTATHPWADQRTVTLVGFADGLAAAGDGNIRQADDLTRVLEGLENRARYHRGACRQAQVDNAREARVAAPGVADWSYQLVVCSGVPAQGDLARLDQLAADAQVALGVVVIGQVPSAKMRLWAQPDGRLTSPLHGIDVQAQCLGVDAARSLAELYEAPQSHGVSLEDWAARVAAEAPREAATAAPVQVSILGPVAVEAPGEVDEERSAFLSEAVCFLALNPGGVHVNRLTGALWPRGVEADVRDQALRQLGQWLGAADGESILREQAGVWSLLPGAFALDWDEFRADVNAAAASGAPREQLLRRALSRVEGLPFADVPAGRYSWLETTATEANILLALGLVTRAVADSAVEREDASTARAALVRTLELLPANQELWRARLRLEARFATRDVTALVTDAMYVALAAHAGPVGATGETEALVSELLPGYQRKVAMAANH